MTYQKSEFELYPHFVSVQEEQYKIKEEQTDLTYQQRMTYLKMVDRVFEGSEFPRSSHAISSNTVT